MTLYNAVKCVDQARGLYAISGDIYGHPRFNDGTRITIQHPTLVNNSLVKLGKYNVFVSTRKSQ